MASYTTYAGAGAQYHGASLASDSNDNSVSTLTAVDFTITPVGATTFPGDLSSLSTLL